MCENKTSNKRFCLPQQSIGEFVLTDPNMRILFTSTEHWRVCADRPQHAY